MTSSLLRSAAATPAKLAERSDLATIANVANTTSGSGFLEGSFGL
jgi:hypothetical protein